MIDREAATLRGLEPDDVILERGRPGYPARLAATADAPPLLFVRGNAYVLNLPAITVVGARDASDAGRARARKLAYLLAKHGFAIASGLARGIDTAAHTGALQADGTTFAVIGTPLTCCYPSENAELQRRIAQAGAVISQFAPASKTKPYCFPLRNATMSALTLGTVVIEAADGSGSLIQARKALEQGRGLFIPRGLVENRSLSWPRTYLSRGAHVFASAEELIAMIQKAAPPIVPGV
ncbi:MAG TPA: DNA-processing protein DprA [Candidatus Elarobacter sp.]|jgi:DNA processing protein|nr:DNA-processing protein DprA [Candidatus Elarobacter sp.]